MIPGETPRPPVDGPGVTRSGGHHDDDPPREMYTASEILHKMSCAYLDDPLVKLCYCFMLLTAVDGYAHLTYDDLERWVEKSPSTVQRLLARLTSTGLVDRMSRVRDTRGRYINALYKIS